MVCKGICVRHKALKPVDIGRYSTGQIDRWGGDSSLEVMNNESTPDGWGIDIWFLIEPAISGYHIEKIFMGTKEHASFEDYREDVQPEYL